MKKVFMLLGLLIVAASCNNDDNSSNNNNDPLRLVKKIKIVEEVESLNYDLTFEYNQDKEVDKILFNDSDNGNYYVKFEYLNNALQKSMVYTSNGTNVGETQYYYNDNGKLSHQISTTDGDNEKTEFSYNQLGRLSKKVSCEGLANCTEGSSGYSSISYTYSGVNISKTVEVDNTETTELNFQYDDKNNPFKNYTQNFRIILDDFSVPMTLNQNNLVKATMVQPNNGFVLNFQTTYDEKGFPKKTIGTDNNGNQILVYEYEYVEL